MKNARYFLLISLFCTTNLFAAIKGKVYGDIYTAPGNIFKMKIPNLSEGITMTGGIKRKIEDSSIDDVTSIAISDSFGNFMIVETYSIPRDVSEILKSNKDAFQETTEGLFLEGMSNQQPGRKTSVLEKTYFYHETLGHVHFGVYSVPDPKGMVCLEKGSVCETKWACLFTLSRDHMVIARMCRSPEGDATSEIIRKHANTSVSKKHPLEELKEILLKARLSMQFKG